jgi:acetyl esterase/lipase
MTLLSIMLLLTHTPILRIVLLVMLVFLSVFLVVQLLLTNNTADKYRHPSHVNDVVQCIAAVHSCNDNIVLVGHSAGAHICALIGTCPEFIEQCGLSFANVRGVICLSGVYSYQHMFEGTGKYLLRSIFHDDLSDIGPVEEQDHVKSAFPLTHVAPGTPPFLLVNGGGEYSLYNHTRDFATALRDVGGMVKVVFLPNFDHLSIRRNWENVDNNVMSCILPFVDQLKNKST